MPTYLIERHIPGAGKLSPAELREASRRSVEVLRTLGESIKWLHSYVIEDRIYCVYESTGVPLIEEHARCLGIPANEISEVRAIISPATAENPA